MVADNIITDSTTSRQNNDQEVLIKVDHISKKFCRNLKKALWYGLQDIGSEVVGRKYDHQLRQDEFWALNDLSFEVKRGECLGLIGPNGAGKSTLLKMLNGLIKPDKGSIMMRGRVSALIELMAGFNPILTGLENIYNRGAILGFSKAEIEKKLDDIVEFSEIGDFLHAPVQSYSSGMKVRLGFAVAAQLEPDILILDEVLAVGDVGFRGKCFNKIQKMMQKSAVILVSHSMPQVSRVCSHIMVMDRGKQIFYDKDVPRGVEKFYTFFNAEAGIISGSGRAKLHRFELSTQDRENIDAVSYLDELSAILELSVDSDIREFDFSITFLSRELQMVAQYHSCYLGKSIQNSGKNMILKVSLGKVHLTPGLYSVSMGVTRKGFTELLFRYDNFKQLKVSGEFDAWCPVLIPGSFEVGS